MFEKELAQKFKDIFAIQRVTYDAPGETREQECLFIDVQVSKNTIKDGKALAMVTGSATMFAVAEKLPFGFFSKAIKQADSSLTKDLFFYDIESNTQRFRDIVARGFSFVYFFNIQYDPAIGNITEVDLTFEEQ